MTGFEPVSLRAKLQASRVIGSAGPWRVVDTPSPSIMARRVGVDLKCDISFALINCVRGCCATV